MNVYSIIGKASEPHNRLMTGLLRELDTLHQQHVEPHSKDLIASDAKKAMHIAPPQYILIMHQGEVFGSLKLPPIFIGVTSH
jgi:hypothetical protein